jgi:hypothetical protein
MKKLFIISFLMLALGISSCRKTVGDINDSGRIINKITPESIPSPTTQLQTISSRGFDTVVEGYENGLAVTVRENDGMIFSSTYSTDQQLSFTSVPFSYSTWLFDISHAHNYLRHLVTTSDNRVFGMFGGGSYQVYKINLSGTSVTYTPAVPATVYQLIDTGNLVTQNNTLYAVGKKDDGLYYILKTNGDNIGDWKECSLGKSSLARIYVSNDGLYAVDMTTLYKISEHGDWDSIGSFPYSGNIPYIFGNYWGDFALVYHQGVGNMAMTVQRHRSGTVDSVTYATTFNGTGSDLANQNSFTMAMSYNGDVYAFQWFSNNVYLVRWEGGTSWKNKTNSSAPILNHVFYAGSGAVTSSYVGKKIYIDRQDNIYVSGDFNNVPNGKSDFTLYK